MTESIKLHMPTVFNLDTVKRLADANGALRQLREMGCRVLSVRLGHETTEIVIDRNLHDRRVNFRGIHVTVAVGAPSRN